MPRSLDDLLSAAVSRGILSAEQRDALAALAREDADTAARPAAGILLAYSLGAGAVLFAMGWFLADRWGALGAGGVLAVVVGYAALFVIASWVLRREGYALPSTLALVLAVAMTPIAAWAALRLAGFWPEIRQACGDPLGALYCRQGWIVVELATILAALVAIRFVRAALLTLPIGIALFFLTLHVVEAAIGARFADASRGWCFVLAASMIGALAHLVERRTTADDADWAASLWLAAMLALAAGTAMVWGTMRELRPLLLPVGLVAALCGIILRRRVVIAYGAGALVVFTGWLAFEVFDDVLAFPLALAAAGLAVIVATVLVQRRAPALVRRLALAPGAGVRRLPGGWTAFAAAATAALLMLPDAVQRDRDRAETWRVREIVWRNRARRENRGAREKGGRVEPVLPSGPMIVR